MNFLDELVFLSKCVGSRDDLVQGGGGNISVKAAGFLYIKSSGASLSEVSETCGYSKVPLGKLNKIIQGLNDIEPEAFGVRLSQTAVEGFKRPSIETPLHGMVSARIVVHAHPPLVLALSSLENSEAVVRSLYPEAEWINYATPGKDLALSFRGSDLRKNLFFMQNHGLVVAGDDHQEVLDNLNKTLKSAAAYFSAKPPAGRTQELILAYHKAFKQFTAAYKWDSSRELETFKKLGETYVPICPDDVVFLGPEMLHLKELSHNGLAKFKEIHKTPPKVLNLSGELYFFGDTLSVAKQAADQFSANLQARQLAKTINPLPKEEIEFLGQWEAEKYRKGLKGQKCK